MEKLTSRSNFRIKLVSSLSSKKGRKKENAFMVEGWINIQEAIENNADIDFILLNEFEKIDDKPWLIPYSNKIFIVRNDIFKFVSDTQTPQGLIAVVKKPKQIFEKQNLVVILDRVQDPGNVGTIIRTSDAFGAGVITNDETCDVYMPKCVRATMGSLFHINTLSGMKNEEIYKLLKENNYKIIASSPKGGSVEKYKKDCDKYAIIIGNESKGVSDFWETNCDTKLMIPMKGQAESLNASVAASILIYLFR